MNKAKSWKFFWLQLTSILLEIIKLTHIRKVVPEKWDYLHYNKINEKSWFE